MNRWRTPLAPWPAARALTPSTAAVIVLIAAALVSPIPANASPTSVSVSVSGGALGVIPPAMNGFPVVTLDGNAGTMELVLDAFSVIDARGSGHGWVLELRATPFREWDGTAYVRGAKMLPAGSLALAGLSVTPQGTDSPAPTIAPGPYLLDGASVTVATASAGAGMGRFGFRPTEPVRVSVPAGADPGSYRSELSISVTSGP